MSVGAAASRIGAFAAPAAAIDAGSTQDDAPVVVDPNAPVVPAADGDAGAQALPPTITDGQGRVFRLQQDPVTGHPQYRHAAEQRDQAGNTLTLEILIDLAQDGSFTRKTAQVLTLVNGDGQRETVTEQHAPDGKQTGELVESWKKQANAITTEKTTGTFANGELVRRETDIEQSDQATDEKTHEVIKVGAKIHGTWDNGGQPITDQTIPVVDRTDTQSYLTPGAGINKDTDRTIDFTRHAAGPVNALDWDEAGTLVVRFNGHGDQYIEREMKVPLDQTNGAPDMDHAEVVRTDDKQNLVNRGLMQARIWGGLASNLSWIVGINFARGSLGKGFLGLSAVAAGAQLIGESHAVATKRNDGDWGRVIISGYDMLLTGMLAAYMSGRKDVSTLTSQQRMGLNALGGTGLAMNGAQLTGKVNPIGADALTSRLNDAGIGAALAKPAVASPLDGQWRMEPRFDPSSQLLGGAAPRLDPSSLHVG
jgi:hypothetical protein